MGGGETDTPVDLAGVYTGVMFFGRQFGNVSRFEMFLLFEPVIVLNAALFVV